MIEVLPESEVKQIVRLICQVNAAIRTGRETNDRDQQQKRANVLGQSQSRVQRRGLCERIVVSHCVSRPLADFHRNQTFDLS